MNGKFKSQNLSLYCHFLALHFDRTTVFNVFIGSDEVSTVAFYALEMKFTKSGSRMLI